MTQRETVIERVQKLLALSEEEGGGTEAERLNAAEKAQALITKHNLDTLELEADQNGAPEFVEDFTEFNTMSDHWKGSLYHAIGRAVNVQVHYRRSFKKSDRTYVLVGRSDSIAYVKELAAYLTPYLEIECESELVKAQEGPERVCPKCSGSGSEWTRWGYEDCSSCKGKGYKKPHARTFKNSFYDAAIWRIGARLEERKQQQEDEAGDFSKALVRNDEAALNKFIEDRHGKMKAAYTNRNRDAGATRAGSAAGDNADLSGSAKITKSRGALPA